MVSGFVTSPCDQLRIFSGDARLMRIASKSAIGFAMSKGLERYKVFLRFLRVLTRPLTTPDFSPQVPALSFQKTGKNFGHFCGTGSECRSGSYFKNLVW